MINELLNYAAQLTSTLNITALEVFVKILTKNDDAGRHGVLIPSEAYSFFPELPIQDPEKNYTVLIKGFDSIAGKHKGFGWKYYERYPERRVTKLNAALNDRSEGRRLCIFIKAKANQGQITYVSDVSIEGKDERFDHLLQIFFGNSVPAIAGAYVQLPVDTPGFSEDAVLAELLGLYDGINSRGWIDSLRAGDTGIGYTFETLLGIEENNEQYADFKGIELKCKLNHDKRPNGGKINLFQLGPVWKEKLRGIERLRSIGQLREDGRYACYSQITTTPNNLGFRLDLAMPPEDIGLLKHTETLGGWAHDLLAKRLAEKHSRAVFVKADSRSYAGRTQYRYKEFIYCERPDISRFVNMIENRRIVFELTMSEKENGRLRNHGYPWRLVDVRQLDQLFALQVKLRG